MHPLQPDADDAVLSVVAVVVVGNKGERDGRTTAPVQYMYRYSTRSTILASCEDREDGSFPDHTVVLPNDEVGKPAVRASRLRGVAPAQARH